MIMDDELRTMIIENKTTDELRNKARDKGMRLLRDSGIAFIYDGVTTAEEIIRETVLDA
jgi:type II secretory ATPase GspE/PulE/Tfp pilus assembly ATPase PilB-like protein